MKDILTYYKNTNFITKIFLFLRWVTAPFEKMEQLLPQTGEFLDIGCGHGLFDLLLAIKSKRRKITGIDPDGKKIRLAKTLTKKFSNLSFIQGFYKSANFKQKFDIITIIDVLYLLSPEDKRNFLSDIKKVLKRNGILVIKTNNASFSLGFFLCYLQELISVVLVGITSSNHKRLYFYSVKQYKELFRTCQYKIIKNMPLETTFFHPHYLFILKSF